LSCRFFEQLSGGVVKLRVVGEKLPRVAWLLALVLLIPVTSLAAVTGSSAVSAWSERQAAVDIQAEVAASSALVTARAQVGNEALPSAILANAAGAGVNQAQLTRLSGVDFESALLAARPLVDRNATLQRYPSLRSDYAKLTSLRKKVDAGQATYRQVGSFFTGFTHDIDLIWQGQLDHLRRDVTASSRGTGRLTQRISVLPAAFALGTTAVQRVTSTNDLLRKPSPAAIESLSNANGAYLADMAAISKGLGPTAAAAWQRLQADPAVARFEYDIKESLDSALAGRPSPLAANLPAHALAFGDATRWLDDMQALIQGSAADVVDVARHQEAAATGSFELEVAIFLLSVLFAAGAAVLLIRSVVRPLRRLARTARQVADGDFTGPAVRRSGPREVADTISAVEEVTAVLAAVEAFTVTLADDPTSATLDVPLPGRTGLALQTTLDRLRESVREAERQRSLLQVVATHDGLTGLLNRNAALDAVNRELSRARRDHTNVMLLFVDLDGLKNINDTYGHRVGDDAIRRAAGALRGAARDSDVVARLGGDEFLVAGGPVERREDVEALADRLRDAVSEISLIVDDRPVPLRCSVGIAMSDPGDNVESLIHKADQALYEGKTAGRNRSRWYQPISHLIPAPAAPSDVVTPLRGS
jgi:diguanylate cyclase (GGDEF)-like protein